MSASASEANQIHTYIQHVLHAQEEKIEALNNLIKDKDALIIYLQNVRIQFIWGITGLFVPR